MAQKKWISVDERKWELNRGQIKFEELLAENGYEIKGVREYTTKMDYLIEKDGVQQEYAFPMIDNLTKTGVNNFKCFVMFYETTKKHAELMAQMKEV